MVLRLLLLAWSVVRLVRTCEWDARLQKAEWHMAGLTITVVAPAVAIALVVLWWPWPKGMFLAASVAFLLGFSLGYFVEEIGRAHV